MGLVEIFKGRIHIKQPVPQILEGQKVKPQMRLRVDPAGSDPQPPYEHLHLYSKDEKPLDMNRKPVDRKSSDAHIEIKEAKNRMKGKIAMERLSQIQYWDEPSLSLDVRYYGDEVEIVTESYSILFKNCIDIHITTDLIYKTESFKYEQNSNQKFTLISIIIEDYKITSEGVLAYWEGDKRVVANGIKAKLDFDHMFLDIVALDVEIRMAKEEEKMIRDSLSYFDA